MRIDMHTHSIFSDGELVPSELVRRAMVLGHDAIAITDHVDVTNVEHVVKNIVKICDVSKEYIRVIPGVEITHVPPSKIAKIAKIARELGAQWIVVHGETPSEPVIEGTNRAAVKNPDIDLLAHPGFINEKDVQSAIDNDVILEITGRCGHNVTNGYVASVASKLGAKMIVNSDAHSPENLMTEERAMAVALGSGLTKKDAVKAVRDIPIDILKSLNSS